jgi:uncharacterized protein (DUF1330 family)
MRNKLAYLTIFIFGLGTGASLSNVGAAENAPKQAYLIVSSDRNPGVSGTDYAAYQQAAGPLARAAGLTMTASSQQPVVFEGTWPYQTVAIERFDSMDALKAFWYSDAYQEAKKLREGLSTVNFIVGVESN